jgi:hypothetical protein
MLDCFSNDDKSALLNLSKAICEGPYLLGNELVPLLGNSGLAVLPIKIVKKDFRC